MSDDRHDEQCERPFVLGMGREYGPCDCLRRHIANLEREREADRAAIRALDLSSHGGCESCAKVRRDHAAAIERATGQEGAR